MGLTTGSNAVRKTIILKLNYTTLEPEKPHDKRGPFLCAKNK